MGGVAAAALTGSGREVTLCVRRPFPRLTVEKNGTVREVPAATVTDPGLMSPVDWVLLATKAQDTPGAAPWLNTLVGPGTVVAVLQNGVDHVERVGALVAERQLLPAIVYAPGEAVSPGHIRAHGAQRYIVPSGAQAAAFAALFEGSEIAVEQSDDFTTAAWRKFLANISANPITALTMSPIGILRDPEIRHFARGLLAEAMAVARAVGAHLDDGEIEPLLDAYAATDPDGGTSMYFDRLAGRPMEHEYLTGALVRKASQLHIDVPLNRAVLALLRGLQSAILRGASR